MSFYDQPRKISLSMNSDQKWNSALPWGFVTSSNFPCPGQWQLSKCWTLKQNVIPPTSSPLFCPVIDTTHIDIFTLQTSQYNWVSKATYGQVRSISAFSNFFLILTSCNYKKLSYYYGKFNKQYFLYLLLQQLNLTPKRFGFLRAI